MSDGAHPRRVGVLGGMFDPPHLGHQQLAQSALADLDLDQLLVVVAGNPPHRSQPLASAEQRLALARAAFADDRRILVSDVEARPGGPRYMVDTIAQLREHMPDSQLVLILGADQLVRLHQWDRWDLLIKEVEIGVARRADAVSDQELQTAERELTTAGARIRTFDMPQVPVSSTVVRDQIVAGQIEQIAAALSARVADILPTIPAYAHTPAPTRTTTT